MSDRPPDSTRPSASRSSSAQPGTHTDPFAADPRLWGRTYAIPFDGVWGAARALADGGLRRWSLLHADDREGVIDAQRQTWISRKVDEIRITVRLDENAQTRVDLSLRRTEGKPARRGHPALIGKFFAALDHRLDATPEQKLDPTARPAWQHPSEA